MESNVDKKDDQLERGAVYMPHPDQYLDDLASQQSDQSKLKTNHSNQDHSHDEHQGHVKAGLGGRWRKIGRVIGWLLILFVVAAIGYGVYLAVNVAKVSTQPFSFAGLASDSSGRTNVLILGVGDPGHAGEDLSDTIMVMSLNRPDNKVAQISVPRDLRVDVPGYGEAKINAADADGGPTLSEQTVSNTLDIPINYYLTTDFTGLEKIVDAVGGIDVDVKQALVDPEYPCANNQYKVCGLDIQPGEQHMDGALALEYVRCRKGTCGNDFGRAARQQEVLDLVRAKVVRWQTLFNPVELNSLVSAIRDNVHTDMSAFQLMELGLGWQHANSNQPIHLVYSTSPGGYLTDIPGSTDLQPIGGSFTAMQQAAQQIFNK